MVEERKEWLEYNRQNLWKAYFNGRANKGTFKAIDRSVEQVKKSNENSRRFTKRKAP